MTPTSSCPKLRPLNITPVSQNGRPSLLLRDPLQLSENYVVLPHELGPALMLMDGERDVRGIHAALLVRFGLPVDRELVQRLVEVLDANYLLDNERFREAEADALEAYRRAPFRPPALAGQSYPDDPDRLRQLFDGLLAKAAAQDGDGPAFSHGRGVFSPHIDYPRGGHVYAAVWHRAQEMALQADLVVLLGTDHYSAGDRLTLTRQHYATPYGVLPTHQGIVDALAEAIGPEAAFAGELRNRGEHSLELVATWLHHMRGGEPVEMVPVLTGSFGDFIQGQGDPTSDPTLEAFLSTLRQQVAGRRVLVVASGDLSHVGPAFGGRPLDAAGRQRIAAADAELVQHLSAGSAEGFFTAIRREQDRNNVCGVSPFYLALRLMGSDVEGQLVAYDQCPADSHNTSLVSVCGMVFG
ncbi:MAG: AmmeMemoRadiSam system protein B [Caldilineales bacterium]|nr:AmmeMemoRadiSam system protein B [Caldilineales bacterium]